MSGLTIAWILLSVTIIIIGAGAAYDKQKRDVGASLFAATVVLMPLWWAIYFMIR